MTISECVKFIKKELKKEDIVLTLVKSDSVYIDGEAVEGYYDPINKKLAVATKKDEQYWVATLIHEYSHYKQFKRKTKAIKELELEAGDMIDIINLWVHRRIELTAEQAHRYITGIKKMEKEADRMTISFIKRHKLPIDIKIYRIGAKKSLAYYDQILQTRRFE